MNPTKVMTIGECAPIQKVTKGKLVSWLAETRMDKDNHSMLQIYVSALEYIDGLCFGNYLGKPAQEMATKMLPGWIENPKHLNHDGFGIAAVMFIYNQSQKLPITRKDFEAFSGVLRELSKDQLGI